MMDDADCSVLKSMLQYCLKLEPLHKARDIILELIAVLEGRGLCSKVFIDD